MMSTSVRRLCIGAWLAFVLSLAATEGEKKKAPEYEGDWVLREYSENGKPNEAEVNQKYRVKMKDGVQEKIKDGKVLSKSKYTITGDAYPKRIDFVDEKEVKTCGILTFRADMLYISILSDPEMRKTERPTDFASKGNILAVYERPRP